EAPPEPPPAPPLPRAATPMPKATEAATDAPARARRGLLSRHRSNRRITVQKTSILVWLSEVLVGLARRLLILLKVAVALAALAGALWLGRLAVQHVVASSRFALREILVGPAAHLDRAELVDLAGGA